MFSILFFGLESFGQKLSRPKNPKTQQNDTLATRQWVRQQLNALQNKATVAPAVIAPVLPELPPVIVSQVQPTLPSSGCEIQPIGLECIWLGGTDGIEYSGTTLTGGNKKTAIDNWYEDGGRAIQLTMDWHDMEKSAGVWNQDNKSKLFSVLNYLQAKQMKMYLKLHMSIGHLQCMSGCPSHIYDVEQDGVRISSGEVYQNGGGVPMTFSSPKITNMERYWNLVSEALKPYKSIVIVSVTNEPNQELQYVIDAQTDYHPLESQAFATFQMLHYGNFIGAQPVNFYGEIGKRWMAFKSANLVKFAKKWGKIFTSAGISTIYDCGSFSDNIIWRGNWGVPTDDLKPEITGLKDNPDFWGNYDIELIAGLTTSYNANLNLLETTYNPQQDIGSNVTRIVHELERAKQAGVRIVNFSFFSNYHDKGSPNYQTGHQVLQQLKQRGWLGKTRVCGEFCNEIPFYSSKALQSGGFMGAYSGAYRDASRDCDTKGKPRIKVINDL